MPRLSLYRPEKGNDYKFQDRTVWEMFQVGGTDVLLHKYIGPGTSQENTPSTPVYSQDDPTNIQDMLFLENRDRKYDPDIYRLRGVYNVQDIDFNLSQFVLVISNAFMNKVNTMVCIIIVKITPAGKGELYP